MIDRARYLSGQKIEVVVSPDIPTFADTVDPERNKKTYEIPPGEPEEERLIKVRAAKNPLLEAARVLLRAQADIPDMPDKLERRASKLLRPLLVEEMRVFQRLCEQANIRLDHMIAARYCLCTALDEAAMQTAWGKDSEWTKNGLATTFREDREGGDKVYWLIGRLLKTPDEHVDLLEVIYRILSLGFEGRFRHEAGGPRKHFAMRERLYKEIMSRRAPVPNVLSPNGQSDVKVKRPSFYEFPVWISVAVSSVMVLCFYGWCQYDLWIRAAEVRKEIAEIVRIASLPVQPALDPMKPLNNEIAAGTATLAEDERRGAVTRPGANKASPGRE